MGAFKSSQSPGTALPLVATVCAPSQCQPQTPAEADGRTGWQQPLDHHW
jgi:hypothetical protein